MTDNHPIDASELSNRELAEVGLSVGEFPSNTHLDDELVFDIIGDFKAIHDGCGPTIEEIRIEYEKRTGRLAGTGTIWNSVQRLATEEPTPRRLKPISGSPGRLETWYGEWQKNDSTESSGTNSTE